MDDIVRRLSAIGISHYQRTGRQPRPFTQQEALRVRILATQAFVTVTAPPTAFSQLEGIAWKLNGVMDVYERHDLLDQAMNQIPLHQLHEKAEHLATLSSANPSPLAFEDALTEALVQWYKHDYMRWVDLLPCPICSGPATMIGFGMPTSDEHAGQADRVELHRCQNPGCAAIRRFPRYNDPAMLMKTREGRCGEWANLFTLFLRAVGLRARYVWNREDHVWNEYFSPSQKRWVHIDSCEAARDQPTLYEKGWGKKMSYIFAFSIDGARDISQAYTRDWPAMESRRNWVRDDDVERVMRSITSRRRAHLSPEQRMELEREDSAEDASLAAGPRVQDEPELPRQSGSVEWTKGRGEAG